MTNTRFEDLERRVKVIKLKKYIKVSVFLFLLLALGLYFIPNNSVKKVDKPLHVKIVPKKKEVKIEPKIKEFEPIKQVKPIEQKKENVVQKTEVIYDTIKLSPNIELNHKSELKREIIIEKTKPKRKINFSVKEVKSEDALLERFKVAGDFESAMGLAYLYFEKKNFEKSIYWSKKASKLSSGDESAWIVYAKAKSALGKVDDAIKALQLYLEYFSSEEIEKLLKFYKDNR